MEQGCIHKCRCPACRKRDNNPTKRLHARLNVFLSVLDERQRRLFVGLESLKVGHGGDRRLARITGMNVDTVARGRRELQDFQADGRIRKSGGGRPAVEKKRLRFVQLSNACYRTTRPVTPAARASGSVRVSGISANNWPRSIRPALPPLHDSCGNSIIPPRSIARSWVKAARSGTSNSATSRGSNAYFYGTAGPSSALMPRNENSSAVSRIQELPGVVSPIRSMSMTFARWPKALVSRLAFTIRFATKALSMWAHRPIPQSWPLMLSYGGG